MRDGEIIIIISQILLEAIFVFILTIVIPISILFFTWDKPIRLLPEFVQVAYGINKLSDIILIIAPIASLNIATGFTFAFRLKTSGRRLTDRRILLQFSTPIFALLVSLTFLYSVLIAARINADAAGGNLHFVAGDIYVSLVCIFLLDVFKLYFDAGQQLNLSESQPSEAQQAQPVSGTA